MKREKSNAISTREKILDAAYRCFDEWGYATTSLETIAKEAELTRGAIYWNFKDKNELYREVVRTVLEKADVTAYAYALPEEMTFPERICELFDHFHNHNSWIGFVFKAINVASIIPEFSDVMENIRLKKIELYRYFMEETRIHLRSTGRTGIDPQPYAASLYLLFEGMFITRHVSVGLPTDQQSINKYIHTLLNDIV